MSVLTVAKPETMSTLVVDVAQRFNARRSGKGYLARCPAHDDRKASLSISEGRDGRVLLKCFAGCAFDQIVSAVA
jgi:DNA primase